MSKKQKLLIVEDDAQIQRQLKWALADEYKVHLADNAPTAMKMVRDLKPEVITLDLGLPPRPDEATVGMDILLQIMAFEPNTKVIVITGNEDRENGLKAISRGAWDYYHKPINIDELKLILARAFHVRALERENLEQQEGLEGAARFDELIGSSAEMNEIYAKIRKVNMSQPNGGVADPMAACSVTSVPSKMGSTPAPTT